MAARAVGDGEAAGASGVRLAELVATLSLAADLGLGQPMEHAARSCLIAMRLGKRLGLGEGDRVSVYYVTLLAWVGCIADSRESAAWFGDDIALRADTYDVDFTGLPFLGFLLRHAGAGGSPVRRARLAAALVATGARTVEQSLHAHCQVTGRLAQRLGLGAGVCEPLQQIFARWDGKGLPEGVRGEAICLPVRLLHIADIVEVHHRRGGVDAAIDVARRRSGTQFDPAAVDAFCGVAADVLGGLSEGSSWDELIGSEPALRPCLTEGELDTALEAIADYADLKSPYFTGHSRGVAELAAAAARQAGHPAADVRMLHRAALVHDLGRTGVPNTIWDKPGPLSTAERERVRLHAYYTERMLQRPPALRKIGAVASLCHERLDGSGYHHGISGAAITVLGRLLGAADAYQAMTEPRPHRAPLAAGQAARVLREEARAGRLDAGAVDAVLAGAGHRVTSARKPGAPAGLTPREVEVLVLVARGASSPEVARQLGITAKTARNHIERIYLKIGVSSRAAAALFAMEQGLLRGLEPTEA